MSQPPSFRDWLFACRSRKQNSERLRTISLCRTTVSVNHSPDAFPSVLAILLELRSARSVEKSLRYDPFMLPRAREVRVRSQHFPESNRSTKSTPNPGFWDLRPMLFASYQQAVSANKVAAHPCLRKSSLDPRQEPQAHETGLLHSPRKSNQPR
jgi:hypothetical protein